MQLEVLFFDGCPGVEQLLPTLRALADEAGEDVQVELRRVESAERAQAERFLGSPTVRVDGEDVEPGARTRRDFGLGCRLYPSADGPSQFPPEEWIRAALGRAAGGGR